MRNNQWLINFKGIVTGEEKSGLGKFNVVTPRVEEEVRRRDAKRRRRRFSERLELGDDGDVVPVETLDTDLKVFDGSPL